MNSTEASTYGLLAEFETAAVLVEAMSRTRAAGYTKLEAYTPYPVDELSAADGSQRTLVPLIVLVAGCLGGLGGFLMQYYAAVLSYPINVGGRPLNSWPMFIPVTFELTVLTAALCGLLGMLALNRLPTLYHPVFNAPQFARASRDRFFLCIEATDAKFDSVATRAFLKSLQALDVVEVPN
jgi:hypothetical protein